MARIAILGAGVMGSAMAVPAARAGHRVDLVGTPLDEAIIRSVAGNGLHPRLGVTLPETVTAHLPDAFGAVMADPPDLLVLGVSSAGIDWAIDRLAEALPGPVPILMITKGLVGTGETIEVLPARVSREVAARTGLHPPVMAVGGPCIAGELAARRDTSVVLTGPDPAPLAAAMGLLEGPFYHARLSDDVVGVEVCAAFKNFYALGIGAVAGRLERDQALGGAQNAARMHNLAASAFTQALEEMTVLVEALGGRAATVLGLPGSGDLYVTCLAGRNSRMGRLLGLGLPYSQAKAEHMADDTVEGAQLALDLGPSLDAMLARGTLPPDRLPLLRAILGAVCRDAPLDLAFEGFHAAPAGG